MTDGVSIPPVTKPTTGARVSLESTVVAGEQQISCDLPGEAVILSLRKGMYFGLNGVAARVWDLLQEPRTVREIRDAILVEYEVEEEACTLDLIHLIKQLRDHDLVDVRDGKGTSSP